MRVLVLGGAGMLGHELWHHLSAQHETWVTVLTGPDVAWGGRSFDTTRVLTGVDVRHQDDLLAALAETRPQVVVNAVGIVKQRDEAKAALPSLEVNSLYPHRLSNICAAAGVRLIHMSTDCVFSGDRGSYTEEDPSDARDLYGRTKYLGEVTGEHCVTLRTSIIGLELRRRGSLIEWFLSQRGEIKGFRKAIYTGFTTMEMARIIGRVITHHTELFGMWHVASLPIDKFTLLSKLSERLGRDDIHIQADDTFVCDRSMDATRFNRATGYQAPSWDQMLDELAERILARRRQDQ